MTVQPGYDVSVHIDGMLSRCEWLVKVQPGYDVSVHIDGMLR